MTLHKNSVYFQEADWTVDEVKKEVAESMKLLERCDKFVTVFGSHRTPEDDAFYQHCKTVASKLGEQGFGIISGGGPGIMHAANAGATAVNAESLGFAAKLLVDEQITDPIYTGRYDFHFLFVRKFVMSIKSDALIFYPGGFGTLDELSEFVTLMQTHITDTVPVICVGKEFWSGLLSWMEAELLPRNYIKKEHLKLIHVVDSEEEVLRIINP